MTSYLPIQKPFVSVTRCCASSSPRPSSDSGLSIRKLPGGHHTISIVAPPGKEIVFGDGTTLTIAAGGRFQVEGDDEQNVTLRSETAETPWYLVVDASAAQSVNRVSVADCDATGGAQISAVNSALTRADNWKNTTVIVGQTVTWTGAAGEDFTDPNNWTDGDGVAPDYPHSTSIDVCFGASDVSTARILEGGTSANNFTFLSTAVNSFEFHATNAVNASGVTLQQYYLVSKSALPQRAFTTIRSRNGNVGAYADGSGALFVTPTGNASYPNPLPFYTKDYSASRTPLIRGDVRLWGRTGKIENVCGIKLLTKAGTAPFTRLTVVKGASLTYANTATTGFAVTDASIDVEEDATLTYANTQQPYQWTAAPSDFRIDGTFDIQAPFVGGFDQTYGGSGVLKTAEIRPDELGDTALNLRDTLVLEPSQDWVTANDAAPTNTMRLAVTGGNPSIRLSNDWTYGPVEGTQTGPVDRSLVFNYGTTLTVDAGGHRATFKDYLTGRGTLIVTNGTTKLDYSDETRTNIRVCNTGVLEWTSANTLASLTVLLGGVLRPLAAAPLTFPSKQGAATAMLTGSVLDIDRALVPASGWLTILRAEKGITGLPTLTDAGLVCRVRTVDGYAELQVKEKTGMMFLVR